MAVFPPTKTSEVKAFKVLLSHESTAWLLDTPQSGQNYRQCLEGGEVLHMHTHFPAKKNTSGRWVSQVKSFWAATESQPAKYLLSNSITVSFARIPFNLSSIKGFWMGVQALKTGRAIIIQFKGDGIPFILKITVWTVQLPSYFFIERRAEMDTATWEGQEALWGGSQSQTSWGPWVTTTSSKGKYFIQSSELLTLYCRSPRTTVSSVLRDNTYTEISNSFLCTEV